MGKLLKVVAWTIIVLAVTKYLGVWNITSKTFQPLLDLAGDRGFIGSVFILSAPILIPVVLIGAFFLVKMVINTVSGMAQKLVDDPVPEPDATTQKKNLLRELSEEEDI